MHTILMSILPHILNDNDQFIDYDQFLIDFPDEKSQEFEQQHLCLGYHMKDNLLKYSTKENYIKIFNCQNKCIFTSFDQSIRQFINQDYRTDCVIPVKHFLFNFQPIILQNKLEKMRKGVRNDYKFTQLELAYYLQHIV